MQQIVEDIDFKLEEVDGGGSVPSMKDFVRPFELDKAPLIRVGLFQSASDEGYLLLDMHHIISDGMSQNVIIRDFLSLYEGEDKPALTLQYKDFSNWQQSEERKATIKGQRDFWLNEFSGEPSVLDLPADFSRPAVKNFQGASVRVDIGPEELKALKTLAEREGSTLFMAMLSLYNVLLHKLSGQDDIVVGTPVAGRPHADLERMVGMFVNTLSLRNSVRPEFTFRELMRMVKKRTLSCLENQDYPYEELIEELNVERDASRNPLFDAALIVQNFEAAEFVIPGLTLTPHDSDYGVSKFDIALVAEENPEGTRLVFIYATELFKKETIERFAGCLRTILSAITNDPEIKLSDIDIISSGEKHLILDKFNEIRPGHITYPGNNGKETIVSLFEKQVEQTPDNIAVVLDEERVSYRQLNGMANAVAKNIIERLGDGDVADRKIALLFHSSVEMIVAILGVLKSGCAYVPLSAAVPVERNRFILSDCQASLLLTTEALAGDYAGTPTLVVTGEEKIDVNPGRRIEMDHLCNLIYTSGTTGQPKGVAVKHKGIANFALWRRSYYEFTDKDVILQLFSYFFDGYGANLFPCLLSGATLVITTAENRLKAEYLVDLIRTENVSSMVLTPTMYSLILGGLEEKNETAGVRSVTLAGEKLPPELLIKAAERMPDALIDNEYGLSETSIGATCYRLDKAVAGKNAGTQLLNIPIGRPIFNYTLYILDSHSHLQPIGVAGELCIGGEGVALGYVNNEALSAQKFVSDPYRENGRMFRTGDLARWLPDGNIELVGRMDTQVKIRGFRIETGEIESELSKHPLIRQAVVVAKENEGGKYLLAYYVADGPIESTELRSFLGNTLPDYMVPSYYVHLVTLPLGQTGKLDLRLLPDHQIPVVDRSSESTTEIQDRLIAIWAKVLKIDASRIGIHSNFFELGGHSINIVKMNSIINETFNCRISVANMFRLPTIRSIGDFITNGDEQLDKMADRLDRSAAEADENISLLTETFNGQ
jgi:amino acid adenylation domain-containing protein